MAFSSRMDIIALVLSGGENAIFIYCWNANAVTKKPDFHVHFPGSSLNSFVPPGAMDDESLNAFKFDANFTPSKVTEL
jgi:hypothetical protein